jgi:hypothetical protein
MNVEHPSLLWTRLHGVTSQKWIIFITTAWEPQIWQCVIKIVSAINGVQSASGCQAVPQKETSAKNACSKLQQAVPFKSSVSYIRNFFLPRRRCYVRTAALRLLVQPCDEEKNDQFFSFFQVMEHRWNEIDRGKPKYSGEIPVPVPLCPPQIPHGPTRDRTRASAVRGRWRTVWAKARPYIRIYFIFA